MAALENWCLLRYCDVPGKKHSFLNGWLKWWASLTAVGLGAWCIPDRPGTFRPYRAAIQAALGELHQACGAASGNFTLSIGFYQGIVQQGWVYPFLLIGQPVFNWFCRKTLADIFFNHSFLCQLASHSEELVSELNTTAGLLGLKCDLNPVLLDSVSA